MKRNHVGLATLALAMLGCATLPPQRDGWSAVAVLGNSARDWGDLGRITGRGLGMIAFDHSVVHSDTVSQLGELALFALTRTPEDPKPADVCTGVLAPNTPVMSYEDWMRRCARRFVTAYGIGASPFGVSVRLGQTRGVRWDLDGLGGVALFNHDLPYQGIMPFTFTASVGASATFATSRPMGVVSLGYRLQHFSNAGMSTQNPAIAVQSLVIRWILASTPRR